MKKVLIIVGVVLLIFGLLYVLYNYGSEYKIKQMLGLNKSVIKPAATTNQFTPGEVNPAELNAIKEEKDCTKLGKKWTQFNCIKAPCPGICS